MENDKLIRQCKRELALLLARAQFCRVQGEQDFAHLALVQADSKIEKIVSLRRQTQLPPAA